MNYITFDRDNEPVVGFRVSTILINSKQRTEKKIEMCTILIPRGNLYCRQVPRFIAQPKGLSPEINMLIRSPIQVLTEAAVAKPDCTRQLTVAAC